MRLSNLLKGILPISAKADKDVLRLQLDSRKVAKGDLFFAVKGISSDGRKYISEAITKGAAAVLVDADESGRAITFERGTPLIAVPDLKQQIGPLAARFFDYPAKKLRMIGVTGTNGKTSCTHFIAQALGEPCGVIGTLGSGIYGALGEAGLTTPDAITLQEMLHQFVRKGVKVVAMEVSSHSIDQGRVNGIEFEMGVFTNLTQDHLDYHGSMKNYAEVKKRFFTELPTQKLVINADDAFGKTWIKELANYKPVYAYSCYEKNDDTSAYSAMPVSGIYAKNIQLSLQGISAEVRSPFGQGNLSLPLIGQFNLSNVLAVLTVLCVYGIDFKDALKRLSKLTPVPGRMQTLSQSGMPLVVVDYSHTPDSLEKALQSLRPHVNGKLICVFGCGGDRDAGKRPLMAKIAEDNADKIIVTNDNPRHEQPEEIARQIINGFTSKDRFSVELDRSKAIGNSIQWASENDCILIAGKGAEHYQQIGDEKAYFDDVEEAYKYIGEKIVQQKIS